MYNRNLKYRFHRRDSPYLFVEDKASVLQDQPAQNYVAQINQVIDAPGKTLEYLDYPDGSPERDRPSHVASIRIRSGQFVLACRISLITC